MEAKLDYVENVMIIDTKKETLTNCHIFNCSFDEIQTRHIFLQRFVSCSVVMLCRYSSTFYVENSKASDMHFGRTWLELWLDTTYHEKFSYFLRVLLAEF